MPDSPATVVLVHGAWHGPWCFDKVVDGLAARDVPTLCVDRRRGDPLVGADDSDENERMVREQMAGIEGPIVLLGHSFGGVAITTAALDDERVKHLVYLTAIMPDAEGGMPASLVSPNTVGAIVPGGDGTATVREDAIQPVFYHQCSDEDVARAKSLLVPDDMHGAAPPPRPRALAYETIPATYVVCTEDRCLTPEGQREQARRAARVAEWPTDHSPFFSRPDLMVDLLDSLAREYAA